MPIYEYHCEPCEHTFETLIRGSGDLARCPRCGNIEVAKQFSVPAAAHIAQQGTVALHSKDVLIGESLRAPVLNPRPPPR